jgi:peptidoglycan/LPS O-acetylase OafA/YrhL
MIKYRSEIDGLRALAVIPVILFHAGFKLFSGGFVGVDVFFVISGYLITTIMLTETKADSFSFINFYERRARRILPALFLVMLVCLPFAWFWLLPSMLESFSRSLAAVPVFASNILFWETASYFDTATELKPLIHTWSLAVEEQYYILFPPLLVFISPLGKRWTVVVLSTIAFISLAVASWGSKTHPSFAFYLIPSRAWELLIGVFIAFYYIDDNIKKHNRIVGEFGSLAGLLSILYAVFIFDGQTPFPSLYTLIPTFGAALIIIFATHKTIVGKFLGNKIFVAIGLISYSAYLWHQPVFAFARNRSLNEPSSIVMFTLAMASFGFAYLSWVYVERPFRNKHYYTRKQVFIFSIIGSVFFIILGLVGHFTKGFQQRLDAAARENLQTNMNVFEKQVKFCWDGIKISPKVESACHIGTLKTKPAFAIIGDSSMGALVDSLNKYALNSAVGGVSYTFRACPTIKSFNPIKFSTEEKSCADLRASFLNGLEEHLTIPKTIIIGARYPLLMNKTRFDNQEGGVESGDAWVWNINAANDNEYKAAISDALTDPIKLILKSGRRVILIYPIPEAGWDVPMQLVKLYLYNHQLKAEDASTSYSIFIDRNKEAYKALDSIGDDKNLVRIKPEQIFCNTYIKGRCITHLNSKPLYFDNNHLSNEGANLIVQEIMKYL